MKKWYNFKMKTFAKNAEKIIYDGIEVIKLNNYLYVGDENNNNINYIAGKSFIFYYNDNYHSFMHESAGQYELIKKYIPDVVPYFFGQKYFSKNESMISQIHPSKSYFIDMYKMYDENGFFYHQTDNVLFEETYIILDVTKIISDDVFENINLLPYWMRPHFDNEKKYSDNNFWQLKGLELIRDRLLPRLEKKEDYSKKIYISRRDANLRHITSNDESKKEKRYYRYEPEIDVYFFDRGYEAYAFEGMPLLAQMEILLNATHVVGLSGGGLVNTLICSPNTKVISVQTKSNNIFSYKYMADSFQLDYTDIDISAVSDDPQKIKEELDKYSHLY